ncbi:Protein FAM169A, partial [Tupaia chinensis]
RMAFPVDMLDNCSHEELENSAEDYMSDLRCGDPENPEYFSLLNITVSTLGERVVLYVLNRIIYRKQEMERNEIPFLCHSSTDYAKILWKKGEAIGFYSVKPTGSMCTSFLTQSYQLPVLDTMFVRKKYRGRDFGLNMLEDFVDSFTEDALGLRYPLSSLMCTAVSQNEAKRPVSGEYGVASVPEYETGSEDNQASEMQLTIDSLKDAFASTSEGHDKTPVSTRTRSSNLKRPKIGKRFQDSEFSSSQGEDEKTPQTSPTASINKLESTARTSESSEEFPEEEPEPRVTEFEDESSDKDTRPGPETQTRPEKQDGEKESESEPMNGEIMDDTLKTSLITEEEDSTSEVLDEELKLQSFNSNEDSTNLVPLVVESSKPSEAVVADKDRRTSRKRKKSEASSEQLDQFTQSAEKAVDSSSEEIEVEVPVVDRRNLRRKAKGHKGPAKKKAKLT